MLGLARRNQPEEISEPREEGWEYRGEREGERGERGEGREREMWKLDTGTAYEILCLKSS